MIRRFTKLFPVVVVILIAVHQSYPQLQPVSPNPNGLQQINQASIPISNFQSGLISSWEQQLSEKDVFRVEYNLRAISVNQLFPFELVRDFCTSVGDSSLGCSIYGRCGVSQGYAKPLTCAPNFVTWHVCNVDLASKPVPVSTSNPQIEFFNRQPPASIARSAGSLCDQYSTYCIEYPLTCAVTNALHTASFPRSSDLLLYAQEICGQSSSQAQQSATIQQMCRACQATIFRQNPAAPDQSIGLNTAECAPANIYRTICKVVPDSIACFPIKSLCTVSWRNVSNLPVYSSYCTQGSTWPPGDVTPYFSTYRNSASRFSALVAVAFLFCNFIASQ